MDSQSRYNGEADALEVKPCLRQSQVKFLEKSLNPVLRELCKVVSRLKLPNR